MKRMLVLLTALLVCASTEAIAAPRTKEQYQVATKAYRQLDAAGQQQWLRTLVRRRMQPAAEMALSGEDLTRQQEFASQVLQRAANGRTLSDEGVKTLLARADQLEKAAIDKLTRLYRVEVYQAFHSDRREFELRMAAYRRVEDAYNDAGAREVDRQLLIDWLSRTISRLRSGNLASLPPMPKFGEQPAQLAQASPRRGSTIDAPPQPTVTAPKKTTTAPPVAGANDTLAPSPNSTTPPVAVSPTVPGNSSITRRAQGQIGSPIEDRPQSHAATSAVSPRVIAPSTAAKPVTAAKQVADVPDHTSPAVEVDLDELSIRITGYNLALRSLASRLDENAPSVADLEDELQELADLVARRGDLLLYCQLLPASTRQQLSSLDSFAAVVAKLAGKISAARHQIDAADNESTHSQRRQTLASLDALSRQLARLAASTSR